MLMKFKRMQFWICSLRRIAALERQKINDEYEGLMADIVELNAILASEAKQREIIKSELTELILNTETIAAHN